MALNTTIKNVWTELKFSITKYNVFATALPSTFREVSSLTSLLYTSLCHCIRQLNSLEIQFPSETLPKLTKELFRLFNTDDCNDLTWRCCCYPCMSFFESNVGRDVICLEILNTSKRVVQRPCTSRWIIQSHLPLRTTIELQKSCVYHPLVPPTGTTREKDLPYARTMRKVWLWNTLFIAKTMCI